MTDWIAPFLEALLAERGAATNTLAAYHRDLLDAAGFFAAEGRAGLAQASRADLEAYLADLETRGLARATRARRLSALKQLYAFAYEEGLRADNPALKITGPKRHRALPRSLGIDDVDRLLAAARDYGRSDHDCARNHCLMQLIYATGLRVSELVSLPVAMMRNDPEMVVVRGKGGKERMVLINATARAALADWITHRDRQEAAVMAEKKQPASRFLFPSRGRAGHMSRMRFFGLIKEIAAHAGLSPDAISPHTMRHAFATHLLARGADLRAIQSLLGHADIATTEIYTHVLNAHLRDLVFDHHPLAKEP